MSHREVRIKYSPHTHARAAPGLVTEALGAPEGYLVEAVLPLGYSDDPKPKEPRKFVEEFTHRNKW